MAATSTASSHFKKKPTTIRFRRRRIKETTISSSVTTTSTTTHHHHPSAVSPENTSWCCPPAVSSYKPPLPQPNSVPPPVSPSPESFSGEKHQPLCLESNLEKPKSIPTMATGTTVNGVSGNYQEPLSSFTQFNSVLTAGLLNPSSPPPTRSSPTLFEMMANEPDSKISNNGPIITPKRPSNGHLIPPLMVVDKQSLMQQRLQDILSCRSPGNLFNDPNSSDVKLTLSSKDGLSVCMSVHRQILVTHSRFFADKLVDNRRKIGQQGLQLRGLIDNNNNNPCIIEIADCDDIEVYIESIRLMYCKDLRRKLMKDDVPKVLGILKVSAAIGFDAGVLSCLEYLEAAPWGEDDEEKVSSLLSALQLEGISVGEVLKRVSIDVTRDSDDNNNNQETLVKLLHVVLEGKDEKARRDMKILVSKMLHENSSKNDLKKESLYSACDKCLHLLKHYFIKASKGDLENVDQITRQSSNLHWLLDILIDRQISEDFLKLWASQTELSEVHSKVPAIHRYEISKVTARLFVGIGKSQLLASKESRCLLLQTWLDPFYDDFTWMRRGSRGFDRNLVEEGLSNTILTLSLDWQQEILMSWFDRFLNSGDDCPNLQKGFEIWWKRAFCRNHEMRREFHVTKVNGHNS